MLLTGLLPQTGIKSEICVQKGHRRGSGEQLLWVRSGGNRPGGEKLKHNAVTILRGSRSCCDPPELCQLRQRGQAFSPSPPSHPSPLAHSIPGVGKLFL